MRLAKLVAEREIVRGFEACAKRKDGTAIWGSLSSRRVYEREGEVLFFQGFLEDIAQRKRTDEALRAKEREMREREEFLRMLLDASPASIFATGARGHMLTMNRSPLRRWSVRPKRFWESTTSIRLCPNPGAAGYPKRRSNRRTGSSSFSTRAAL